MTGWEKVIAATLLAVVGLIALNLAVWRRLRVAVRSDPSVVQAKDDSERGA